MADQWLSIVEYARTHAISDMTIRRRIKTGRLKAVLRDGKYYIPIGPDGEMIEEDEGNGNHALASGHHGQPAHTLNHSHAHHASYAPLGANLNAQMHAPMQSPHSHAHAPTHLSQPSPTQKTSPAASALKASREVRANPIPSYQEPSPSLRPGASFKTLPQPLSQNLSRSDQSLVDTQALLQFCDKTVTRINSIERHLQDSYQARMQTLETQLRLKDSTIAQLKQQVEDLQMLVKLMERR